MKKITPFIVCIFILSGIIVMTGCQKWDYDPSMNASINSQPFSANGKDQVIAHVDTSTHNPQLVIITGSTSIYTPGTSFQPIIKFTVPNNIGTYSIDTFDNAKSAVIYTASTGNTGTRVVSGQVVILNISGGKIQGNFNLTCADGTQVTNGHYIATEEFY